MRTASGRARSWGKLVVAAVATFSATGIALAPSASASYTYYDVIARHSGRCLDVAEVSTATGANVYQWDCWGGQNQQWRFKNLGNGYYQVIVAHSGKCLDVSGVGTGDGVNVQQWDCLSDQLNQQWRLSFFTSANGYNWYKIVARHSGKCLDVTGENTGNGANVQQWTCLAGQLNQQWRLN
ncbi:MAG: hypothetical protein QG671_655 [Actinomycetota bacterium]|nr:hypothetical protein [Actinomycetota bacterium]